MKFVRLLTLLAAVLFTGFTFLLNVNSVSALGLKVAPLEFKAQLNENERKQGFIDVSNPSGQRVKVRTSVQGFKQIDDSGGLKFFDDAKLSNAIKLDLNEFELGPREALRMTFTIDGNLLPKGDVFGAIFFTTEPSKPINGVGQLVRVGTLLSLVNDAPGQRNAQITGLTMPFVQLTSTAKGNYVVKNTGNDGNGFYPTVTVSAFPSGKKQQIESSLVFGGRQRSNDIAINTGFGIHRIDVSYGNSKQSQWVILVAPWMLVALLLVALIIGVELLLLRRRRGTRSKLS